MTRSLGRLALGAVLGLLAAPAVALIGETPTIRAIAVVRPPIVIVDGCPIVLLGENEADGSFSLTLRTISEQTGLKIAPDQTAAIPAGHLPVDVMFSSVVRAGSVLVLTASRHVLEYPLAFDAAGRPKFTTVLVHGPFGPAGVGDGTALTEAPGATPALGPFLGIGTTNGIVVVGGCPFTPDQVVTTLDLGHGAITGLATVPQVGHFAFVAAHNGRAVGVNPGASPPAVVFDLADPRSLPLVDLAAIAIGSGDHPPTIAAPVSFVAANGTREVAVLQIPANPSVAASLKVGIVIVAGCPVASVRMGSLLMLGDDGGSVTLDPGFTLEGGASGRILTAFGSAVDLSPDTLNLGSNGQYVTALIEVADGGAAAIDPGTLSLYYGNASVPAATSFAPQAGDADEDGQADLLVKFDRAGVAEMLAGAAEGPVSLTAQWTFTDSSGGAAGGQIRIKR
jgi:hypothetical protein